eukprot:CAMPEP_0178604564 /NCGR_PEP_ID=MMETSP0697-20121206/36108_1 /TAXON_ID=265572 /ORGANISM="Extubocellulus spinifer, Strain CCMP396" /LENGTH=160 /DNA_ID=CAMNT_0020242937 /DNA_START=330 /DNA_END=812 /DNA_ORIENTATION=-
MSNESGDAALPKFDTESNMTASGAFSAVSAEVVVNRLQSGVVAMNKPIKTPITGGGKALLTVARSPAVLSSTLQPLFALLNSTSRPKLQKKGDHPTRNKLTKAVLLATLSAAVERRNRLSQKIKGITPEFPKEQQTVAPRPSSDWSSIPNNGNVICVVTV